MLTKEEIRVIKRQHPLAVEVERHGIGLRPSGRTLLGRCPFHADHGRPNFTVYPAADPAEDSFFCFACGAAGDVIAFARRIDGGVRFIQAIDRLGGSDLGRPPSARQPYPVLPRLRPWGIAERACLMAATELYRNQLATNVAARSYLALRGIDMATAERCRVGYAGGGQLLPYLRWRRLPAGAARRVGLLDRHGRETMAGRIVVPEFRAGRAVWLIGRDIREDAASPKYLGLPGRKPVLGWETTTGEPAVILAEGVFDWLTLQRWRLPAIGLGGTHASSRLVDALQRFERIYVALDNDPAGQEATQRLMERLGQRAIPISLPPGFNDISDLGLHSDGRLLLVRTLEESGSGHMALSAVTGRESVPVPEEGVAA